MENSGTIKQLRLVISDLYDDKGDEREEIRHNYVSELVSSEAVILLREILRIVFTNNYFTEVTRYYITNALSSRQELSNKFNINKNTINTKLQRDIQKFKKDFGDDCLYRIATNPRADLTPYRKKVQEYSGTLQSFYDEIDLKFKSALGAYSTELDDNSFNELCTILTTYSKRYKERVTESVSADSLGYINYLFSKNDKTDKEEYRFSKLLAIVGKLSFSSLSNIEIYKEIGYKDADLDGAEILTTSKDTETEADKAMGANLDTDEVLTDIDDDTDTISEEELIADLGMTSEEFEKIKNGEESDTNTEDKESDTNTEGEESDDNTEDYEDDDIDDFSDEDIDLEEIKRDIRGE